MKKERPPVRILNKDLTVSVVRPKSKHNENSKARKFLKEHVTQRFKDFDMVDYAKRFQ